MPLPWIGGKNRISTFIIPYIPNDTEILVEPFGGMAWVFLKMDLSKYKNLKRFIYNDVNKLNVNLFNCLKEHETLYKEVKDIESQNKELFYEFQKELFDPSFDIDINVPNHEIAMKYSYVVTQIFSGARPDKSGFIDLKGKYRSKFDSFKNKLVDKKFIDHFERITDVECLDFEDLIKKYDSSDVFYYLDPPYALGTLRKTGGEKYYANHDFNIASHERLAKTLHNVDGKFSLSYYFFEELKDWYPKEEYQWAQRDFYKAAAAKKGVEQNKGTELLIMNYEI